MARKAVNIQVDGEWSVEKKALIDFVIQKMNAVCLDPVDIKEMMDELKEGDVDLDVEVACVMEFETRSREKRQLMYVIDVLAAPWYPSHEELAEMVRNWIKWDLAVKENPAILMQLLPQGNAAQKPSRNA